MSSHRLRRLASVATHAATSLAPFSIPTRIVWSSGRVYAIAFDLDTEALERHYGSCNWRSAYDDVRRVFATHGFERQQGSVYFGSERTTPVNCVLAIQDACRRYAWFRPAVKDIRMLRIEENNDLYPAMGEPELPLWPPADAPAPLSVL